MKNLKFETKVGMNRGSTRIWLEGKRLAQFGWVRGTRFDVVFMDAGMIYVKAPDGKRAVAGTEARPIIDTNSKQIANFCEAGFPAEVEIDTHQINIK